MCHNTYFHRIDWDLDTKMRIHAEFTIATVHLNSTTFFLIYLHTVFLFTTKINGNLLD